MIQKKTPQTRSKLHKFQTHQASRLNAFLLNQAPLIKQSSSLAVLSPLASKYFPSRDSFCSAVHGPSDQRFISSVAASGPTGRKRSRTPSSDRHGGWTTQYAQTQHGHLFEDYIDQFQEGEASNSNNIQSPYFNLIKWQNASVEDPDTFHLKHLSWLQEGTFG